jgi:hypothetical protein
MVSLTKYKRSLPFSFQKKVVRIKRGFKIYFFILASLVVLISFFLIDSNEVLDRGGWDKYFFLLSLLAMPIANLYTAFRHSFLFTQRGVATYKKSKFHFIFGLLMYVTMLLLFLVILIISYK